MKITDETIYKLEKVFGFDFYDWQKKYIKGETSERAYGRVNGKTFAYCIKLLLQDGEPIQIREIFKYRDEERGLEYCRWFAIYCLEINDKLVENGFETRIVR